MSERGVWVDLGNGRHRLVYPSKEAARAKAEAERRGVNVICDREDDYRFDSVTLPRHYKHHQGEFAPDGSCRFKNQDEVRATIAAAHAAGEPLAYAGRRFNMYADDVVKG